MMAMPKVMAMPKGSCRTRSKLPARRKRSDGPLHAS